MTTVQPPAPHLGWYSRGYLPHWDLPGLIQSISFRLIDSLPAKVLARWQAELRDADPIEMHQRIEEYLGAGHGECWLRIPQIAQLMEGALHCFDGERYRLLAWRVMPNHVHVLIETVRGHTLAGVVHAWKSYTSSKANQLIGRRGPFWQREYLDRYIRNAEHFLAVIAYIEENPVHAGLVRLKTDWPRSSARWRAAALH